MTEAVVSRLRDKINELGNQKIILVDQLNKVRKQVEELNQDLVREKAVVQRLEDEVEAKGSAVSSNSGTDNKDKRIDEMVKEIDKCLAILTK